MNINHKKNAVLSRLDALALAADEIRAALDRDDANGVAEAFSDLGDEVDALADDVEEYSA